MHVNREALGRLARMWVPLAVVLSSLCALIYVVVQQNYRSSANDLQIQLSEDAAAALSSGQDAQQIVPRAGVVDIAHSLSPYLIVFDDKGRPITSTATLNGQTPIPPAGVFASVRAHGEDRFTWQPANGVRSAVVVSQVTGTSSGFVLAGRSLRLVEQREPNLEQIILEGWIATLVVSLVSVILIDAVVSRIASPT